MKAGGGSFAYRAGKATLACIIFLALTACQPSRPALTEAQRAEGEHKCALQNRATYTHIHQCNWHGCWWSIVEIRCGEKVTP